MKTQTAPPIEWRTFGRLKDKLTVVEKKAACTKAGASLGQFTRIWKYHLWTPYAVGPFTSHPLRNEGSALEPGKTNVLWLQPGQQYRATGRKSDRLLSWLPLTTAVYQKLYIIHTPKEGTAKAAKRGRLGLVCTLQQTLCLPSQLWPWLFSEDKGWD